MNATYMFWLITKGETWNVFLQINIIPLIENELQTDVTIIRRNRDYLRIVTIRNRGNESFNFFSMWQSFKKS